LIYPCCISIIQDASKPWVQTGVQVVIYNPND